MDTVDRTPFVVISFPAHKPSGEEFLTTIVKGTFQFAPDGRLELLDEQEDLRMADEYVGEPNVSSLRHAADLVPFKPSTDIHIVGAAYSKGKIPVEQWDASVSVDGDVLSELTFTGRREWQSLKEGEWALGDITKTNIVPLQYERASGGHWERRDEEGELLGSEVSAYNPIGLGLVDLECVGKTKPIPAPQILRKGESIPKLGDYNQPAGFSPLPGSWKQRLDHAGTYDEEWEKKKWPLSPDDFDWQFFQSAHPDLICEKYLEGGESIRLVGLTEGGELSFRVPDYLIAGKFFNSEGNRFGAVANLDTVEVDLNRSTVSFVWRMTLERESKGLVSCEIISIAEKQAYFQKIRDEQEEGRVNG